MSGDGGFAVVSGEFRKGCLSEALKHLMKECSQCKPTGPFPTALCIAQTPATVQTQTLLSYKFNMQYEAFISCSIKKIHDCDNSSIGCKQLYRPATFQLGTCANCVCAQPRFGA